MTLVDYGSDVHAELEREVHDTVMSLTSPLSHNMLPLRKGQCATAQEVLISPGEECSGMGQTHDDLDADEMSQVLGLTRPRAEGVEQLIDYLAKRYARMGWRQRDIVGSSGLPSPTISKLFGHKMTNPNYLYLTKLIVASGLSPNEAAEIAGLYRSKGTEAGKRSVELSALPAPEAMPHSDEERRLLVLLHALPRRQSLDMLRLMLTMAEHTLERSSSAPGTGQLAAAEG